MLSVDLNAVVGESFGTWRLGDDAALMPFLTSANVACGFHAGDPGVMRTTVALALEHGVAIGAHPGFPDLPGFGRREMAASPREIEDLIIYQIGALAAIAGAQGAALRHVKPHGALYNMAAGNAVVADAIARGLAAVDRSLVLVGLAGSASIEAGARLGLRTASEVFGDRAYRPDGSLAPRHLPGAVIDDPAAVAARLLQIVSEGRVTALDGTLVPIRADTICVHGDTPGAPALAAAVRRALAAAGIDVTPFS